MPGATWTATSCEAVVGFTFSCWANSWLSKTRQTQRAAACSIAIILSHDLPIIAATKIRDVILRTLQIRASSSLRLVALACTGNGQQFLKRSPRDVYPVLISGSQCCCYTQDNQSSSAHIAGRFSKANASLCQGSHLATQAPVGAVGYKFESNKRGPKSKNLKRRRPSAIAPATCEMSTSTVRNSRVTPSASIDQGTELKLTHTLMLNRLDFNLGLDYGPNDVSDQQ